MNGPRLVVGDGNLGIGSALGKVYPEAKAQRRWNHRIVNALDEAPKKYQAQALVYLRQIPYSATVEEAERLRSKDQPWCRKKGFEEAAKVLDRDFRADDHLLRVPEGARPHLRTTNPIESPFAALRLRTDAAKRFKQMDNALAVIWKTMPVAEERSRRLNAPELMKDVDHGVRYVNRFRAHGRSEEAAA